MTIEIRWLAGLSSSSLHAAKALADGRTLVDPAVERLLPEPAGLLRDEIEALGGTPQAIWDHLIALSAGIENNRQLAEVTIRKSRGGGQVATAAPPLADRIAGVEAAMHRAVPDLVTQLDLRSRPLREQWDARGPGLFRALARQVEPDLLVERADVMVVHPVLGGGGYAHLLYNSVRFEAVLANPHPQLPEVLRLAWLLAQLNCELPRFSDRVSGRRLPEVAALAMLPPLLRAAEEVELAHFDEAFVKLAIRAWFDQPPSAPAGLARLVVDWWTTYNATRPSWSVALQALDQMQLADS